MNKELKNKEATPLEGEVVALKGIILGRVTWYDHCTVVHPSATKTVTVTSADMPRQITIISKVVKGEKGDLTEVRVSPKEFGYVSGGVIMSAKLLKEILASSTKFDPSKGADVEIPVLVDPTPIFATSVKGRVYKTWDLMGLDDQRAVNPQKAKAAPGWANIEASEDSVSLSARIV